MDVWSAMVLGLAQGLTEFLPVSSSGHLVLLQHFLRVPEAGVAFDVFLHLATLLAVVVYFWADLWKVARDGRRLLLVLVGTVPAGLAGVLLEDFFTRLFSSITAVGLALIGTGVILWGAERLAAGYRRRRTLERMTLADAWWVGVGQAVAIIPGLSRSGSTIATGLALGLERETAARFSFILSVPVVLGAAILQLRHLPFASLQAGLPLAAGFLVAFVSGLAAIWILLGVVKRSRLRIFSWYVWAVGVLVLLAAAAGR
ncbi:MAG TPA: undecaprenyl-diphosphate phosphatase [Firmicutes bacterium]|nr:undecaprenyl-diphosphate phosphatase [Bacillota bacterium]